MVMIVMRTKVITKIKTIVLERYGISKKSAPKIKQANLVIPKNILGLNLDLAKNQLITLSKILVCPT